MPKSSSPTALQPHLATHAHPATRTRGHGTTLTQVAIKIPTGTRHFLALNCYQCGTRNRGRGTCRARMLSMCHVNCFHGCFVIGSNTCHVPDVVLNCYQLGQGSGDTAPPEFNCYQRFTRIRGHGTCRERMLSTCHVNCFHGCLVVGSNTCHVPGDSNSCRVPGLMCPRVDVQCPRVDVHGVGAGDARDVDSQSLPKDCHSFCTINLAPRRNVRNDQAQLRTTKSRFRNPVKKKM